MAVLDTLLCIYVWEYVDRMDSFDVLAEPRRRRILGTLCAGDRSVGELCDELALTQPTVSKHLRVLRHAGFVSVTPKAQHRIYRLHPERFVELDAWLEPYRQLWADRLDALERHLDQMEEL